MLVEVGIQLYCFRGQAYARKFLKDVHVSDVITERVLGKRCRMLLSGTLGMSPTTP